MSHQPYVPNTFKPTNRQQQGNSGAGTQGSHSYGGTNTYGNTTGNSNVYAPPIVGTGTSNGYASAPAPASATSTNVYSNTSSPSGGYGTGTGTSSSYATNRPTTTSTYNYGTSSIAPTSAARGTGTTKTLPDFSQALDQPPPSPSTYNPYANANANASSNANANINTTRTPAYNPSYGAGAGTVGTTTTTAANKLYSSSNDSSAIAMPVNNTGGYGAPGVGGGGGGGGQVVASSALNSTTYTGGPTGGIISEGNPTKCHKVDYEIKGHEMQLVEIELDPQETVVAEAGAMMFLEDGIDFKTKFGDGSTPKQGFFKKLLSAGGRLLMGESLFITHFTNIGQQKARVAFAAPYPGSILPINLEMLGGKLICQKDAFLCAAKGTKLSIHLNKKIGSGLFGGEGFILQKLEGDGMAFVHAGGMIIRRDLRGEKLRIDTGCVVGFTEGINFDIQFVPGLKSMIFGGEGLFLATLQGTGTVWMQSLPFSRLADRIVQSAPSIGGRRKGEGSGLTGGVGDMLDGDGFGFRL